jgi:hypothetical protein
MKEFIGSNLEPLGCLTRDWDLPSSPLVDILHGCVVKVVGLHGIST